MRMFVEMFTLTSFEKPGKNGNSMHFKQYSVCLQNPWYRLICPKSGTTNPA